MSFLAAYLETRGRKVDGTHISDAGALDWMGLPSSTFAAGVEVDGEKALSHPAVLSAVLAISTSIAVLPLKLFERLGEGDQRPAREHPVWNLISKAPNPEMTAPVFWNAMHFNRLVRGNGIAEIEFDARGIPKHLWPIPASRVVPERQRPGGPIVYRVDRIDGGQDYLPARKVFHVPDAISFSGLWARSRIEVAAEAIGVGLARQRYTSATYDNGARPGVAIKRPADATFLNQVAHNKRLAAFEAQFRGPSKAGRTVILQEGEELENIGFTPEEAQMVASAEFSILDIARIFGVPPHVLGDLSRATFSNMEHEGIRYVIFCLLIHLRLTEAEIDRRLVEDPYYARHSVEGLLRGDSDSRAKLYQALWQIGATTANEIRAHENMPPIEGGNETYVPLNYQPASMPRAMPEPAPQDEPEPEASRAMESRAMLDASQQRSAEARGRLREAFRGLLEEHIRRAVTAETRAIRRELSRIGVSIGDFREWLTEFYEEHRGFIEKVVGPAIATYAAAVAGPAIEEVDAQDDVVRPAVERATADHRAAFAASYVGRHRNQLLKISRETADPELVAERLDEWQEKAPAKEARWQTVRVDSVVASAVYLAAGRTRKRWRFNGGDCPICPQMNGRVTEIGRAYLSPGDLLTSNDPDKQSLEVDRIIDGPPAHRGCECYEVAE